MGFREVASIGRAEGENNDGAPVPKISVLVGFNETVCVLRDALDLVVEACESLLPVKGGLGMVGGPKRDETCVKIGSDRV